eukprot:s1476_g9.t1
MWSALWLCNRSLRIWEADAPEPLTTIRLPPGTVYLANAAACEHQVVHCLEQDPLLEVQGLGASVALQLRSGAFRQNRCSSMRTGPNPPWLREAVVDSLQRELFGPASSWQLPQMADFNS